MITKPRRILVVDDEPDTLKALEGFLRSFGHEPVLAQSGEEALAKLSPPVDLVLLDIKMPGMDGYEVARQIRKRPGSSDVPIIMVTALGDKADRLRAVEAGTNDFIQKPIDVAELRIRSDALLKIKESQDEIKKQREELRASYGREKELLEKTLKGSVRILVEVLGLLNPLAFSQASRLRHYVQQICSRLELPDAWQFELAAMLSQIGCVTIPPDVLEKHYAGRPLSPEEEEMIASHPKVGHDLLANIPRLETIAQMVGKQGESFSNYVFTDNLRQRPPVLLGAQILQLLAEYDLLLVRGNSHRDAIKQLRLSSRVYDPRLLMTLHRIEADEAGEPADVETREIEIQEIKVTQLTPRMVLAGDLRTRGGLLLARKGQEITGPLLGRLKNFFRRGDIQDKIRVILSRAPPTARRAGRSASQEGSA